MTWKPSPRSLSASTVRAHDRVEAPDLAVEQQAELVAAEAVSGAAALDRFAQGASEPCQQRVAGRVPERVVVCLEAIEVEEQGARARARRRRPGASSRSTISRRRLGQAAERSRWIASSWLRRSSRRFSRNVQAAARHRGEQPGGGEDTEQSARQLGDPAVEQEPEREHGEACGDEHRHPIGLLVGARRRRLPRRDPPWRARSPARSCRPGSPRCTCSCSGCSCRSRHRSPVSTRLSAISPQRAPGAPARDA